LWLVLEILELGPCCCGLELVELARLDVVEWVRFLSGGIGGTEAVEGDGLEIYVSKRSTAILPNYDRSDLSANWCFG
jgi:hypothetical protein